MCRERKPGSWGKKNVPVTILPWRTRQQQAPEAYHCLELLPGHAGFAPPSSKSLPSKHNCTGDLHGRKLHSGFTGNFPVSHLFMILYPRERQKVKLQFFPKTIEDFTLHSFQNVLMTPTLNLMCYNIRKILTLGA